MSADSAAVNTDGWPRPRPVVESSESTTTTTTLPPTTTTTVQPTTTTTVPTTVATVPNERATTTVPQPPSPPAPTGACAGWEDDIAVHFPANQVGKACQVMMCETGGTGDPTIHNPSSSASGLFQFLDGTWTSTTGLAPPAAAYPAGQQIAAAATLWRSSGWAPWSCA